ncbi:MAG: ABC1 kinase family protein [Acidobacteriota bacterium]
MIKARQRSGLARFFTVVGLFWGILWAFYSLKYKKLWHTRGWLDDKLAELYLTQARRFRETAVQLGGLLIKLGQFFSSRVDILPKATIEELALLQDEVQPVSFDLVKQVVENEFGQSVSEVFAELEEMPLASASLGQVHIGRLTTGETVAVKIQRPGIERLVRIDLLAIRRFLGIMKVLLDLERFMDIDKIYQEFAETVSDELDYIKEGNNAETIACNAGSDGPLIPAIHWDHTTRKVLTMEYVQGIKITDYQAIEAAGLNRADIVRKVLHAYVRQVLDHGFFHADPHPGNLFVTPEGRLVMVDFGMVGTISPRLRDSLEKMAVALVKRDHFQVVELLQRIGFLRYDADNEVVARAVGMATEQFLGSGGGFTEADAFRLLEDIEQLVFEQPFQIPAHFTFLGRALATLYGLCIGLDPNFNFLDELKPYLNEMTKGKISVWSVIKDKGATLGASLLELPPLAERVLVKAERGDLTIRVPLTQLNEALLRNTRAIASLAWAVVFGVTLGSSAYLMVNHLVLEARIGFCVCAAVFIILLFKSRIPGRKHAPHPSIMIKRGKE